MLCESRMSNGLHKLWPESFFFRLKVRILKKKEFILLRHYICHEEKKQTKSLQQAPMPQINPSFYGFRFKRALFKVSPALCGSSKEIYGRTQLDPVFFS